jgi:hypothetical protein
MSSSLWALVTFTILLIGVKLQHITDCSAVLCATDYRCVQGICVRQQYAPQKKLCTLDPNLSPLKCTNRDYTCQGAPALPSCGFTAQGKKTDFDNDCSPCLDQQISFYYRVPCQSAPQVCQPNEECVNGNCLNLFAGQQSKDYVSCSSNAQCRPII